MPSRSFCMEGKSRATISSQGMWRSSDCRLVCNGLGSASPYGVTVRADMYTAESWFARRTFSHHAFPAEVVAATRERTVSVCLPARNEAATIGAILEKLMPLRELGVLDQVVVA